MVSVPTMSSSPCHSSALTVTSDIPFNLSNQGHAHSGPATLIAKKCLQM